MTCIFCSIAKKAIESQIIYENDAVLAFLDIKPINPGHTLIVPKRHYSDIFDLDLNALKEMVAAAKAIAPALLAATGAEGLNLAMSNRPAAGQVVMHAHLHLIPRFSKDGLRHWPGKDATKGELIEIKNKILEKLKAK